MPQEKDGAEKILEDFNEVFIDIMNNLVFGGQQIMREDELVNASVTSQMKLSDGKLHQQERDTMKFWKQGSIVLAACGLENQSRSSRCMPMQAFSYDGAVYKDQVNRYYDRQRSHLPLTPFYPAITIVLYFGETRWSGPRTLRACFPELRKELVPFIPDYPIHVVEVAFLTPEEVGRLRSDFRYVADFLTQMRTTRQYIPPDGEIVHVDATLKLLSAITGDARFEQAVNDMTAERREHTTMCSVIDDYINKGREESRLRYERIIADHERIIADDRRIIADKERIIADKDREIHALKQRLGLI